MLEVKNINVFIEASHILTNVSIEVGENEMVCLIGRNGAGKTTILRSVMGFLKPESGSVKFMGKEITGLAPYEIALSGIGYAPRRKRDFC